MRRVLLSLVTILALHLIAAAPLLAQSQAMPVVFVHGWCSNSTVWNDTIAGLPDEVKSPGITRLYFDGSTVLHRGEGSPEDDQPFPGPDSSKFIFTIDFFDSSQSSRSEGLNPLNVTEVSIQRKGRELSQVIDEVKRISGTSSVVVVGHSMGGLVARAYIQGFAGLYGSPFSGDVTRVVTVDTPHAGSPLARLNIPHVPFVPECQEKNSVNKRQMRTDSTLLNQLNSRPIDGIEVISIASFAPDSDSTRQRDGDGIVPYNSQNIERVNSGFYASEERFPNIRNIDNPVYLIGQFHTAVLAMPQTIRLVESLIDLTAPVLPSIKLHLDDPRGVVGVSKAGRGWAFVCDGSIVKHTLLIDGVPWPNVQISAGVARPDVQAAYAAECSSVPSTTGVSFTLVPGQIGLSNGPHRLRLEATDNLNRTAQSNELIIDVRRSVTTPSTPFLSAVGTTPSPPAIGTLFAFTLAGSSFDPANVEVLFTGPGCAPCVVPNGVLTTRTSTRVVGPATLNTAGTYGVSVRNGATGPTSNSLPITVPFGSLSIASISPPVPVAGPTDQPVLLTGSGFAAGLRVDVGLPGGGTSILSGAQIVSVSPSSISLLVTFADPGPYTFAVVNPDGRRSAAFPVNVAPRTGGIRAFTDPLAFRSATDSTFVGTNQVLFTQGFDFVGQGPVVNGTSLSNQTFRFDAGGFPGLVTGEWLAVTPPNTLGVLRGNGQNFFLPGESLTVDFAPSRAIGVYFLSGPGANGASGFLSISTPAGTATNGAAMPGGTCGFPSDTLRFVGLISERPFTSATISVTNPSPGMVGFVLDQLSVGTSASTFSSTGRVVNVGGSAVDVTIAQPQFDVCGFVVGTASSVRALQITPTTVISRIVIQPDGSRATLPASLADLQAGQSVVAYTTLNLFVTNPVDATRLEIQPSVQIASIAPGNPTAGPFDQQIVVRGSGFAPGLIVRVGLPGGGVSTLSGSQIRNVTPASFEALITLADPGAYSLQVIDPDGQESNRFAFSAVPAGPQVTGISPSAPFATAGNQPVTVFGSGFASGLNVTVTFPGGGSSILSGAQIVGVGQNSFQMLVDFSGIPGQYSIRVTNPNGQSSNSFTFTVVRSSPAIAGITPASPPATAGDQQVAVSGSGFQPGLSVLVRFPSGGSSILSGSQILFASQSSFVMLINFSGIPGTYSIQVFNPDGVSSNTLSFTVR
jgi:pimeloyl-ACP methyl ester carboxylesterase